MKNKITIIDYGMGNLFNLVRALESIDCKVKVTNNFSEVLKSEKLILPGVGAFKDGMKGLKKNGLIEVIREFSEKNKPLLGICLGMQLLMTHSEENGSHKGLGIIKGEVLRFKNPKNSKKNYKIPQIGWNGLLKPNGKRENKIDWNGSILKGLMEETCMYFLHSYYVKTVDEDICSAETLYGENLFCSVFQQNKIFGCQFHPERSGENGLKILNNFSNFN